MMAYYIRLAWLSMLRTPVLSVLMIATLGIGIGLCMTVFSLFHMMSSNPMAHKDDVLFAVQLDSWDPNKAYRHFKNDMPDQVTYQDAMALLQSDIPSHQAAMFASRMTVYPGKDAVKPFTTSIRVTTNGFFSMFELPFLFGGPWQQQQDESPSFVAVIDQKTNNKLFHGENSVGKTLNMDGDAYTIVGVLAAWELPVNIYDMNMSLFGSYVFGNSEGVYIPLSLTPTLELQPWGNTGNWKGKGKGYKGFLLSETVWLLHWVELPTHQSQRDFAHYLENYIRDQKAQGRFPRPLAYALNRPSEWLALYDLVGEDNRVLLWLSFSFLAVCVINAAALILAKFMRNAPEAGVRRALGASQSTIFLQHLIETSVIGVLGGVLGLALSILGLMVLRNMFLGQINSVATMDISMISFSILLALVSALLSGCYPAWRVSHTTPAVYLKIQ